MVTILDGLFLFPSILLMLDTSWVQVSFNSNSISLSVVPWSRSGVLTYWPLLELHLV